MEKRRSRRVEGSRDLLGENIGSETAPVVVVVKASISDYFMGILFNGCMMFFFQGKIRTGEKGDENKWLWSSIYT